MSLSLTDGASVLQSIKAPDSIDTTFENLGYYLGEGAKQRLLHVAFLHLLQVEMKKLSKLTTELPSTSQRIMLSSPHGSDIYQEAVVQALAKHCQARLLVYDRVALKVGGDDPVGSSDSGAQSALRRLLKVHSHPFRCATAFSRYKRLNPV
jgi:hypothetical protein